MNSHGCLYAANSSSQKGIPPDIKQDVSGLEMRQRALLFEAGCFGRIHL